jgi:aspartyl-tRNA synthetase
MQFAMLIIMILAHRNNCPCMMLLGQESIRDVILFPQLKPK